MLLYKQQQKFFDNSNLHLKLGLDQIYGYFYTCRTIILELNETHYFTIAYIKVSFTPILHVDTQCCH